ncbi:sensor histidine kinase [Deinococcus peraridilitoris]|uniref:histidine kinase n=1 Tax=Deinococcus peraridilitoris (strain DSM 19664 / LMG 22246 / CIP 109416 / KR-200) TaxID=937777 RepID=L0A1K0_DEIPD|nr:ATP-binding protein [Deinococcus peraridilitoris]AFZ66890.1 bacteriophytochrome (light-regulated signal transduction histidine kinase) [Deinococcus peraridilitoris DSM 19664]
MRHLLSQKSLRAQLLVLLLLVLLGVLSLLVVEGLRNRNLALEQARRETRLLTRLSLRDLETDLFGLEQALNVLAILPEVQTPTLPTCSEQLRALARRFQAGYTFGVATREGRVVCASQPLGEVQRVTARPWFRQARARGQFSVGNYEVSVVSSRPALTLALPVPARQFAQQHVAAPAVVFASLDLSLLNRLSQVPQLPPGTALTLFDRSGTILARFPEPQAYVGRRYPEAEVTRGVLMGRTDTAELRGLDGTLRLYSFTPLIRQGESLLYATAGIDTRVVYQGANASLRLYLLAGLLLSLTVFTLTLRWGSRRILQPLDTLRRASRQLARGDLHTRAQLTRAPLEFQGLAGSFNLMAASLESRIKEVEQLTRDLELRVQERTAQLQSANETLESFAYTVAHDLRTPLRTIHGFTSAVSRVPELQASSRADLQRVLAAVERMDDLIRDLLAYSQLTRAEVELHALELSPVVCEVLRELHGEITRTNALVEVAPNLPPVVGNTTLLRQVLLNLIGNALKFSIPGQVPRVSVTATHHDSMVRISVQDQGIGVEAGHHERIFGVFTRLHLPSEYPGTGIGLAIVSQSVKRMNGQVGVKSEPGQGSCFWIILPSVK